MSISVAVYNEPKLTPEQVIRTGRELKTGREFIHDYSNQIRFH